MLINYDHHLKNVVVILLQDKYVPCKLAKKRCSLPWITPSIKSLIKARDKLYDQLKQTNSSKVFQQFKELKHCIQKEM